MITLTHLSSCDGTIIKSLDELTAEDLSHLLALKRQEPELLRLRADHELQRCLWRLISAIPRNERAAIVRDLQTMSPPIVLETHFSAFATAKHGPGPIYTIGHYLREQAVAA